MKRRGFVGSFIAALFAGPTAWKQIADAQEATPVLEKIFDDEVQLKRQPIAMVQGGYMVKLEAETPCKVGRIVSVNVHGRIVHMDESSLGRPIGIVVAHDIEPNMEIVQVYDQQL